jgi:hypothetical protein
LPLALSAGCTGAGEDSPELAQFASCGELESWVQTSALKQINYSGGFGGGVIATRGAEPAVMEDSAAGADTANLGTPGNPGSEQNTSSVSGESGNRAWSTTNVQEDGVDEADFVKNDGDHIFALDRSGLTILDAWPAEDLHETARVEIEGSPQSMFFDAKDSVVVFSSIWNGSDGGPAPLSGAEPADGRFADSWSWEPVTKLTVIDVSDRSAPDVIRESYFDGTLSGTRRIGSRVHALITNSLVDWVYAAQPAVAGPFPVTQEQSKEAQRARVRAASSNDWLPALLDNVKVDGGWSSSETPIVACTDVYKPNVRTELVFTGVVTLDLDAPEAPLSSVGALTRADVVYASAENLYIGLAEYEQNSGPFPSLDGSVDTRIHKFALQAEDGSPAYVASGIAPGTLLNSFSLGEHDGFLRIATTTTESSNCGPLADCVAPVADNNVYVIEQEGESLVPVGSIQNIAEGESIYSVRFVGDKGYMVTFERIDPLFTLDLSDPRNPQIMGELEVSGFSNYLHPMDESHLIAVGEEIDPQTQEWQGMQVSLFDVSDFAAPALQDREIVSADAWSEAQYDHRAFTFFAEQDVLALPVSRWDNWDGSSRTGLELFSVTAEEGIESLGEVDHSAFMPEGDGYSWCSQVRRSIFIEDYVFAVSDQGIQVVMLQDPSSSVAGMMFEDGGCDDYYAW